MPTMVGDRQTSNRASPMFLTRTLHGIPGSGEVHTYFKLHV